MVRLSRHSKLNKTRVGTFSCALSRQKFVEKNCHFVEKGSKDASSLDSPRRSLRLYRYYVSNCEKKERD